MLRFYCFFIDWWAEVLQWCYVGAMELCGSGVEAEGAGLVAACVIMLGYAHL